MVRGVGQLWPSVPVGSRTPLIERDNEWGFTHQMIREARSTLGVAAA
jgi:hypothetical protein